MRVVLNSLVLFQLEDTLRLLDLLFRSFFNNIQLSQEGNVSAILDQELTCNDHLAILTESYVGTFLNDHPAAA